MKFEIGQKATFTKKITKHDIELFAEASGDCNPIHLDEEYANKSLFGRPIAHGILCAGLISSVIAQKLPGEGTIYLGQHLRFLAPVFYDELLTAEVEILEIIQEKKHLILKTIVRNQENANVIEGSARVKVLEL